MDDAVRAAGGSIGEAVGVFMLHPQTLAGSIAAGYRNPFAGYVVGRGGVLAEATGPAVARAFTVFSPDFIATMWEQGTSVRPAAEAAGIYWNQVADFGRRRLAAFSGASRLAELGERIVAATPGAGLPLYSGWRTRELAEDAPARALQVMFVLRELRGDVHFTELRESGIHPLQAHLLNKGPDYAAMFGWSEPFPDIADQRLRYAEVEAATNRRMTEVFSAAVDLDEAQELAELAGDVLAAVKATGDG